MEVIQKHTPKIVRQVTLSAWLPEVNHTVALLDYDTPALEKMYSISFEDSYDDLDYIKVAVLEIDTKIQFALVHHTRNPVPGTEIWISPDSPNIGKDLDIILTSLGMSKKDLKWKIALS